MTKTAKTKPAASYFDQVRETMETMQAKFEVPATARDFVQRGATTARERAESVHQGAEKLTDGMEKITVSLVGGYANFVRGLLDATYANVEHALATVEKVAGAKSVNEAVQIQVDYVRENAAANFERMKNAAETARTTVVDGAKTVQSEVAGLYQAAEKKAA